MVVGGSLEGRVEVDLADPRRPEPTAGDSRGAFAAVGHSGRYLGAGQRVDQHQGPVDIGVDLVLVQRPSLWMFRLGGQDVAGGMHGHLPGGDAWGLRRSWERPRM